MTDRLDAASGLRLVASPSAVVYRVAKSSYGPLNPPVRDDSKRRALTIPTGWWVDVASSDTLSTVSAALEETLLELDITGTLTLSELTSNQRRLTTRIATWLREEVTLDDGTQPLGVQFPSKYGRSGDAAGTSWAYWMRAVDVGLSVEPVAADHGMPIELSDPAFKHALKFHKIDSR